MGNILISLRQRHPQKLPEIGRRAYQTFQANFEKYRAEHERRRADGDKRSFEEVVAELEAHGWFEQQNKLLVQTAILLPETTKAILSFEWYVLKLDPRDHHELLTSDRPVIMTNGIGHDEGHIALPVGPQRLFVAARARGTINDIARRRDLGRAVNDTVVKQAFEQVYGGARLQIGFVQNRLRPATSEPIEDDW